MDVALKEFSDLIELIYAAGTNPASWPIVLSALSKVFAGASGVLHRYDPLTGHVFAFEEFGHDADFSKSYVQHYGGINPYPAESFHRLETGKVDYAGTLLPLAEVIGTEFYNDWMKPQGISPNHLGVVLSRSGVLCRSYALHLMRAFSTKTRHSLGVGCRCLSPTWREPSNSIEFWLTRP